MSNAASMPTTLPQCRWISFPPPPPPLHLEIVHSGGLLAPSARPSVPPSVLPSSLPPPPRPREEGGDGGRKGSWKAPRTALAACDLIRLLDPILADAKEGGGGDAGTFSSGPLSSSLSQPAPIRQYPSSTDGSVGARGCELNLLEGHEETALVWHVISRHKQMHIRVITSAAMDTMGLKNHVFQTLYLLFTSVIGASGNLSRSLH